MTQLSTSEITTRAQRIKLVLTDVDGVLTDTGVFYSARGEEMRRFSIRDGMGMEILRDHGIETAMISREGSENVRARSAKLKLRWQFLNIWDKHEALAEVLKETGLQVNELAYIGDDVNDLEIMKLIAPHGLTGCPQDAMPVIQEVSHFHSAVKGGYGAFRDFADWILRHAGN
jgi:3-deoxy-D-manno-octulosonate 8-phosphate phosphatase (KDO 8-P phosphatase)